jgi:hypothetical protein
MGCQTPNYQFQTETVFLQVGPKRAFTTFQTSVATISRSRLALALYRIDHEHFHRTS